MYNINVLLKGDNPVLNTEIWKEIPNLPYDISNLGNVRRQLNAKYKYKNRLYIKPYKNNKGYLCVNLYKECKVYKRQLHRLIAQAFIPNPNNLDEINHIDGNPLNNSIENLEWCTHQYNIQHAWNNGLFKNHYSNASVKRKNCSSKYRGVHWDKARNKWATHIGFNKKHYALGRFNNEEDAAKAYDKFIKENNLEQYGYKLNFS